MLRLGTRVFEEQSGEGVSGGEAPVASSTTTATETAPAAKVNDQAWLKERLERAERKAAEEALKAAGFASLEEAKQAKALAEAQKTEAQRQAEKLAALEPKAQAADDYRVRLERYADAELAKLTDAQRDAVLALSGGDKAKALDAVEALRPTWVAATPASPAATPPTPPGPSATAPGRTAPPAAATAAPTDARQQYQSLKSSNPFAAADTLKNHWGDLVGGDK